MVNTIEYIDVKLKCTPENYMIILTNVTPINLIKKKKRKKCRPQVIPMQLCLEHRLYTRPAENIHVELQHDIPDFIFFRLFYESQFSRKYCEKSLT